MSKNNSANNDPLGNALGLPPLIQNTSTAVAEIIANAHDDSAAVDFENARANIIDMIEVGKEAVEKLSQIAALSQSARAFEVLAKLIETTSKANQDLLVIQEKIRSINSIDSPIGGKGKTINNNLFVGSTAELQKMIKDLNTKSE